MFYDLGAGLLIDDYLTNVLIVNFVATLFIIKAISGYGYAIIRSTVRRVSTAPEGILHEFIVRPPVRTFLDYIICSNPSHLHIF